MVDTPLSTPRQSSPSETWTLRFTVKERVLHALIMTTFIGFITNKTFVTLIDEI